ncbi:MAG: hypothetical protein E4H27_06000 [Anaerolineales bacterium]|nr:MAG: hypothetical protein E4H27_06000 [Anaerolineales bacterium]
MAKQDENFIIYDKSTLIDKVIVEACHQVGFESHVIDTSLRVESVLGLVAPNSGIALIMRKIFDHAKHHVVIGVLL